MLFIGTLKILGFLWFFNFPESISGALRTVPIVVPS